MASLAQFAVLSDALLAPSGFPEGMRNNNTCLSVSHDLPGAAGRGRRHAARCETRG